MYLGDFIRGAIIPFEFSLSAAVGGRVAPSSDFEVADLVLHKGTSTTERASTAGFAIAGTFDARTGLCKGSIDTGDNTDAGWFVAGEEYALGLYPDETVDGQSVAAWVARFSLQRASALKPVVGLAQGGAVGNVQLPTTASSTDAAYKGAMVRVRHASGAVEMRQQGVTAYVGATRTFYVDPDFDSAPTSTSEVEVYLLPPAPATNVPDVNAKTAGASAVASIANGVLAELAIASGTIGATGNDTTHLHLPTLTFTDDEYNSYLLILEDVSGSGVRTLRWIADWVVATKLATVVTLPFTPQASTDLWWLIPMRADVTGGSGLDAAGVRAAVGLASANLDTQLAAIAGFIDTEVGGIISSLNTIAAYIDTEVGAIKTKTDTLPADTASTLTAISSAITTLTGYVDTEVLAIKAKTDLLTLAAISQAVLKANALLDGNKIEVDEGTSEIVLYDTDGTTELGRAPFTRLSAAANPLSSVGG